MKSVCFESRKSAAQQRERGRVTRVRTHTRSRAQSFKKRRLDFSLLIFGRLERKEDEDKTNLPLVPCSLLSRSFLRQRREIHGNSKTQLGKHGANDR